MERHGDVNAAHSEVKLCSVVRVNAALDRRGEPYRERSSSWICLHEETPADAWAWSR